MVRVRHLKPKRSLRTILIILFLLFSVAPLVFVTFYSVIQFQKAIDGELKERLSGNFREFRQFFEDYSAQFQSYRGRIFRDPTVLYPLAAGEPGLLRELAPGFLVKGMTSSMSVYARNGRLLGSLSRPSSGQIQELRPSGGKEVFLSSSNLAKLADQEHYDFVDTSEKEVIRWVWHSKLKNTAGKTIGYFEHVLFINHDLLKELQKKWSVEILLVKMGGEPLLGTHPDFKLYDPKRFLSSIEKKEPVFFDLAIRQDNYGFYFAPLDWGSSQLFVGLGAPKSKSKAVLTTINIAFLSVVSLVIVLLVITIWLTSSVVLRPINDLVKAIQSVQSNEHFPQIPVRSQTEIGLLTDSFNQMNQSVQQAKNELKKKILELEKANREIVETQSKLVHSSKMISLGHLVAGVAHELNNPIGFIYSNMTHLNDYSKKLIDLIETAQNNPSMLSQKIQEYDLQYIKSDLPKLVSSCEDGARRTRDIVLGLRNFSRLDRTQVQEMDVNEALNNTLQLLASETKNRIQVHRDFEKIPLIQCYSSQINQVLMNLLSNACQAIEGSGNIWIKTQVLPSKSDFVRISIQDSGRGMTPEVMEKIFDPFFSTKAVGQGTGLGLSISYGIIQAHRGEIQVKSQPGIGTEFILFLPIHFTL